MGAWVQVDRGVCSLQPVHVHRLFVHVHRLFVGKQPRWWWWLLLLLLL
jgi:hypothetical protein